MVQQPACPRRRPPRCLRTHPRKSHVLVFSCDLLTAVFHRRRQASIASWGNASRGNAGSSQTAEVVGGQASAQAISQLAERLTYTKLCQGRCLSSRGRPALSLCKLWLPLANCTCFLSGRDVHTQVSVEFANCHVAPLSSPTFELCRVM